jgi:hypothetical protein
MKIEHKKKEDPFNHLSILEKRCMYGAFALAFAGVFVWFVKIIVF